MFRPLTRLLALIVFLAPSVASAQGVLVVVDPHQQVRLPRPIYPHHRPAPPRPPATYKISELDVQARLVDQIAKVQVSQSFVNMGSRPLEVSFLFPLPYDGAIDQMTLMVDGQEYPAKLLAADDARKLYEDIVRKNRDPALLEWMGTGVFQTSVFPVPAGATRTVSLRYSQICRKQDGLTDFLFPLSTAKYTSHPVERVAMRVTIESQEPIKNVYSPTHALKIQRPDERHATVSYETKNEVPSSDFRLLYDVGTESVVARVLSYRPDAGDDGFFLLLASPSIKAADASPAAKTMVFVVDRSGSMSGEKIKQAREALKFVLNNLREGDLFNIVAYDSDIELFRPELQKFNNENRKAALGFVEGIHAGGSTNIDGALAAALGQLQDTSRPNYVVFLTDGLPTAGETNERKIVANAREHNQVRARLFAFGVGYDVNSRLLDRLVRENFGQSEYVRPDEDIEECVGRLYRRISSPVMTDVQIEFVLDALKTEEGRAVNRVYPAGQFDLFAGEQLVVVGRYHTPGVAKVVVRGKVGQEAQKLDFTAQLVETSADDTQSFIEKLWAIRRIGEILDQLDLKGSNDELIKELVGLATRHGVLTPYTSFLADESTSIHDLATNAATSGRRIVALEEAAGQSGFVQRRFKGEMQYAAAPAASPMPSYGGMGGGLAAADEEAKLSQTNIRNIGNRAFYRRDGQWIDSTVDEDQEKNATRVKQFSDDYFKLAGRFGRNLSQYMVFDEPVVVNLDGQAYLIEP